ncbi:MAG: metallophosphoesterase family protein [Candidatus Kariarchaeaceae archaeon]
MKIGLLADIHGSEKNLNLLLNHFEREKIDLVLIAGDIAATVNYKLIVKSVIFSKKLSRSNYANYVYSSALELFDKFQIKSLKNILKRLNKCSFPTILIPGNSETNNASHFLKEESEKSNNLFFIDNDLLHMPELEITFIGYSGTLPAVYRRAFASPGEKPLIQMREELSKIEQKLKDSTDPVIFLTHDAPYGTKLDIIKARKEQGGNKALTEFIERVKPLINIHGHIHENRGTDRIGKTLLINPGAVVDGRGAIYDYEKTALQMLEGFSQGIKLLSFSYKIRTRKKFK